MPLEVLPAGSSDLVLRPNRPPGSSQTPAGPPWEIQRSAALRSLRPCLCGSLGEAPSWGQPWDCDGTVRVEPRQEAKAGANPTEPKGPTPRSC